MANSQPPVCPYEWESWLAHLGRRLRGEPPVRPVRHVRAEARWLFAQRPPDMEDEPMRR